MTSTQIPWAVSTRLASTIAGRHPLEGSYHERLLELQAPEFVARAEPLVAEVAGLVSAGIPEVRVVTRAEWAERNIAFFAHLMDPIEDRLSERMSRLGLLGQGGGYLARRVMAAETGALLGVMARHVLGQYELALPTKLDGDTVYLVGANILSLERNHQFRPFEFRFWLALHECTHRLQFVGIPWMRDYFLDLVKALVSSAEPEPGRLRRVAAELRDAAMEGRPLIGETGLFGLFANDHQRALVDKVQALMSLLEGHGHVIMDRIGEGMLVTQARMSNVLKQRRKDPRAAAFFRLTGLEMKFRQYEMGERFIKTVEREA
ncbi:MAG TPA: hypothetical protein ENH33_00360, partial [Actinobacteria bacterium]|nr:hypothetical protein [Actinomycetota bacterium]